MRNSRSLSIIVGVLVVAVVIFLGIGLAFPDSLAGRLLRGTVIEKGGQEPTYAEARVNGSDAEWNLASDFFADVYRASRIGNKVQSKLYLRYDCGEGMLYVLVLSAGEWPYLTTEAQGEPWVALGSEGDKVDFDRFAWVEQGYDGDEAHARGFEARFALAEGDYRMWAATNIFDDGELQMSGTDRNGIGLTLGCYDQEIVFLAGFKAVPVEGKMHLQWETWSESDRLGFNVYHSNSKEGPWTKLNGAIIPSKVPPGSLEGASYQWVLEEVDLEQDHFYLLEDIDRNGAATRHGPINPE
ncbi:MAG: hypothetical protein PVG11_03250 [Anaerolineae bacterium]|jgi:hypothetical protein